jgi:hypothetical protein
MDGMGFAAVFSLGVEKWVSRRPHKNAAHVLTQTEEWPGSVQRAAGKRGQET